MFWAEFREYIEFDHHSNGTSYIDCVLFFKKNYGIKSITEDAMLKNYYRWRKKVRNPIKRAYKQKKSVLECIVLSDFCHFPLKIC